jgi:hypothetical protein
LGLKYAKSNWSQARMQVDGRCEHPIQVKKRSVELGPATNSAGA